MKKEEEKDGQNKEDPYRCSECFLNKEISESGEQR